MYAQVRNARLAMLAQLGMPLLIWQAFVLTSLGVEQECSSLIDAIIHANCIYMYFCDIEHSNV